MLELITEAMAWGMEFKYAPTSQGGLFECEEYAVVIGEDELGQTVYLVADLVSPKTARLRTAAEVMAFIQQNMDK